MNFPGFRFRLLHLFVGVLWLSVFLALVAGQPIDVIVPALIGNGLSFFLPVLGVGWIANIRKEMHAADGHPASWVVALIHWTNLIFIGLVFVSLVILAALWQFCWVRGSIQCAIANVASLPIASFFAFRFGWKYFVVQPRQKMQGEP